MRDGGGPEEHSDRLAPVTPLFGGRRSAPPSAARPKPEIAAEEVVPKRTGDAGLWRSTWDDETEVSSDPTPTTGRLVHPAHGPSTTASGRAKPRLRALRPHEGEASGDGEAGDEPDPDRAREAAQEVLVRKLRSKALSVSEARQILRLQEIEAAQAEEIIDEFCARGYLDDATLAWHLVTSGVERKGQGRVALMRALAQRGISRDVIDDALRELPDDDAERALEFARSKARSLSGLEHDTALRRLVGQLSRRGYTGSVAMTAARTALTESSLGAPRSGVRFVDSD